MRFLKTLKRVHLEQGKQDPIADQTIPTGETVLGAHRPHSILADTGLRIGSPTSAFPSPSMPVIEEPIESEFDRPLSVSAEGMNPVNEVSARDARYENGNAKHNLAVVTGPLEPTRDFCNLTIDPDRVNEHLVAIRHPNSPFCEEFRSLRTHVVHACQERSYKSIVMLSVSSSEGKSITALNLSWLLAQTEGLKALVIEADLRLPSLERYLGFESRLGLTDVLRGRATLKEAIIRLDPAGLHFLPSGANTEDPTELIVGTRFKSILQEAHNLFDFVIVDAPPTGLFSDASVLVNAADCALMVVKPSQVRYKDAQKALDLLPREKIIGAVLNQSEEPMIGREYYDHSYYKKYQK